MKQSDPHVLPADEKPLSTTVSPGDQGQTLSPKVDSVTTLSCLVLFAIVVPALFLPTQIGDFLDWLNGVAIALFGFWFVWVLAIASILCLVFAAWPRIGNLKLGRKEDKPEHSYFSWICMLYGAGVGAALLKWSIAEPVSYLKNNPDMIKGLTATGTNENFRMAMKWAFMHWGISAWSCYAITGLALAFVCYRHGKPLNMGSALSPLYGKRTSQAIVKAIHVMVILIGMLCLIQTLSFGIQQTTSNLHWMGFDHLPTTYNSSTLVLVVTIMLVCTVSTTCALSGLKRGIKWLSLVNVTFSAVLLGFLLIASSFTGVVILIVCSIDYLIALPKMAFGMWYSDSQPTSVPSQLEHWQRRWSLFHWTWWIPFTVFVGYFMARISKGRTVREFVVGAMLLPSLMCIVWLSWTGGTAGQMQTAGIQSIEFLSTTNADMLVAMVQHFFSPIHARLLSVIVFILMATYMATTVSSAFWVFDDISKQEGETRWHSNAILWGWVLAVTVFLVNRFGAAGVIQSAMCLFALPTTLLVVSLCGSLVKTVVSETRVVIKGNAMLSESSR